MAYSIICKFSEILHHFCFFVQNKKQKNPTEVGFILDKQHIFLIQKHYLNNSKSADLAKYSVYQ